MLKYLENKYILAAVVSCVSLLGMYMLNWNVDKETSKYKIYLKHSLLIFILVLMVIYFRSSSKLNITTGGGSSIISSQPVNDLVQNVNIGDPNF